MITETRTYESEAEIWMRILYPDGRLTPSVARAILQLSFPEADRLRMRELSARSRAGALTPAEEREMGDIERVGALLSVLKSKARLKLRRPG